MSGYGKYSYRNGGSYTGQWARGVRNGKGTEIWENGAKYLGSKNFLRIFLTLKIKVTTKTMQWKVPESTTTRMERFMKVKRKFSEFSENRKFRVRGKVGIWNI
jgi:hypothetical protein